MPPCGVFLFLVARVCGRSRSGSTRAARRRTRENAEPTQSASGPSRVSRPSYSRAASNPTLSARLDPAPSEPCLVLSGDWLSPTELRLGRGSTQIGGPRQN